MGVDGRGLTSPVPEQPPDGGDLPRSLRPATPRCGASRECADPAVPGLIQRPLPGAPTASTSGFFCGTPTVLAGGCPVAVWDGPLTTVLLDVVGGEPPAAGEEILSEINSSRTRSGPVMPRHRKSYLRFAIWLRCLGCVYGLALGHLARVLGTEGNIDSRLKSVLTDIRWWSASGDAILSKADGRTILTIQRRRDHEC